MAKKLEYNTDYLFNYDVKESVNSVIDEVDGLTDSVNGLIDSYRGSALVYNASETVSYKHQSVETKPTPLNNSFTVGKYVNLLKNSEDVSVIANGPSTTLSSSDVRYYFGIPLYKLDASNYYSTLRFQSGAMNGNLVAGKRYLVSFYVQSNSGPRFIWHREATTSNGHGSSFVDGSVRRVSYSVVAASSTQVTSQASPILNWLTTSANDLYVFAQDSGDISSYYIGGFQMEELPDNYKDGVAVIGDSTVAGSSGKIDAYNSKEWTRWAEGLLNVPFFNRGVGGETTASMDARWSNDITPLAANARFVIIQGGINDISQGRTLAQIQGNINSMYTKALADGFTPLVCTGTPFITASNDAAKESVRQSLNDWIRSSFQRVIDLDVVIRDPLDHSVIRQEDGWVGDGVHFDHLAKKAIGEYVSQLPYWDFFLPSKYDKVVNSIGVDKTSSLGYVSDKVYQLNTLLEPLQIFNDANASTASIFTTSGSPSVITRVYLNGAYSKVYTVHNTSGQTLRFQAANNGTATGPTADVLSGTIKQIFLHNNSVTLM